MKKSSNLNKRVPVVFVANARFFEGVAVAVFSTLSSSSQGGLDICVIDGGLASQQRRLLREMVHRFGSTFTLRFFSLAELEKSGDPLPPVHQLNYARLWIDWLLPNVDQAVYIDSDILVRRAPEEILSFIDSGRALAAWFEPHLCLAMDPLGIPGPEDWAIPYFNSGIMGMNLKFCRENDVLSTARRLCASHFGCCAIFDQTVLNHVLRGSVVPIPLEWNFPVEFNSPPSRTSPSGDRQPNLHFIGKTKPWLFYSASEDFHLWRTTYARAVKGIPFYMFRWRFWCVPLWAWLVRIPWFSRVVLKRSHS